MERTLSAGPDFAKHPGMLDSPREPVLLAARSAATGWSARSFLRWPRRESLLPLAYYVLASFALAATGYPPPRIAFVAGAALLQQIHFHFAFTCTRRDPRQCVNADPRQIAMRVSLSQLGVLLTTTLAVAATGGIRSPFLVTVLAAYLAAVSVVGDRPQTRYLLASTIVLVAGLALLRAFTGPELPRTAYGVLTGLSIAGVGALLAPVYAIARAKREELDRWRKDVASDALMRAQNLEQIGAKVAHELKNPLTGVKALVQLGLRNPSEAASHERLVIVEREVTRMQDILNNYLSFTRPLQAVSPRRIELGSLVSDTLLVLSARADDARVRLFAQGEASVEADPRRLKEALLNLVANAIEATPPGGHVAVDVRSVGDRAEIAVRDTGRGCHPTR